MELEKYLVLNRYFLNLFGFSSFNELREKLKDVDEGYDSQGRSFFVDALIGLKAELRGTLLRYDEEIRVYVEKLKRSRRQPRFSLKYFQYMAVLFTEIFLDRLYNDKYGFLAELNAFVRTLNGDKLAGIKPFTENDLRKLAFWMATGSGKTLIMHINYWQMLKYSKNNWDNVILITPNEGLSKQHYEELRLSGIPCKLYGGNVDNLKTRQGEVLVIDIHKLTEEKKGEGVSVDISFFEGKNLVFIDEGHKGQRSEEQKWKRLREEIGKDGFLFEYSATFGQVIGKNRDLLEEYSKAIIFDYSYKYFYTDGYGKDFYVYNIKEEDYTETQRDLLLTAGLLSFYEQLEVFEKYKDELREYSIEKPLWVFVGSKVTGKGINSDIVRVLKFLERIIEDEGYLNKNIEKIIKGESGLTDSSGNDIFKDRFELIRDLDSSSIAENIYRRVFGGRGRLELYEIKNSDGEIGLKVSTGRDYFGVINVGDVRSLKNLLSDLGIVVKEDHISGSLFFNINEESSSINILIGSKKFVEGWNSWRVSSMCLINMGKGEGPQIIQLFGRGVRLKGRNHSLKREENPDYKLRVLQTLFILGLNADYINAFLAAIEREEVSYEEVVIPIKFNRPEDWEGKIFIIKTRDDFNFLNYPVKLALDMNILRKLKIDLRPRVKVAHGLKVGKAGTAVDGPVEVPIEYFRLIDWESIYSEVMSYKNTMGMHNLILDFDVIKQIVESREYRIFINESEGVHIENNNGRPALKINSFEGVKKFNEIVLRLITDYIQKFYRKEERRKATDHLELVPLTVDDPVSMYPQGKRIVLRIPKSFTDDIEEIRKQLEEYEPQRGKIPEPWSEWSSFVISFDKHLYTPLVIWSRDKEEIKSIPEKLNRGETFFVKDLRNFLDKNKNLLESRDVFLLRHISGKGMDFFISSGFYPDFILWVKNKNKQNIVFIDIKGIRSLGGFDDDKVRFCTTYVKDINKRLCAELEKRDKNFDVQLDAFILSTTPYKDVRSIFGEGSHARGEFEKHNIVFQEDPEYLNKIFKKIGVL